MFGVSNMCGRVEKRPLVPGSKLKWVEVTRTFGNIRKCPKMSDPDRSAWKKCSRVPKPIATYTRVSRGVKKRHGVFRFVTGVNDCAEVHKHIQNCLDVHRKVKK